MATSAKARREAATTWMQDHPDAMELFERLALQAAARRRKFGISLLTERIRWEFNIERGQDDYKIPNNHKPHIARALIDKHPQLAEFITIHALADEAPETPRSYYTAFDAEIEDY